MKQLLASEYNYVSGPSLTGGAILTYLFIYQGEVAVNEAANHPPEYLLWEKDCYNAYNNSHSTPIAGITAGPVLP